MYKDNVSSIRRCKIETVGWHDNLPTTDTSMRKKKKKVNNNNNNNKKPNQPNLPYSCYCLETVAFREKARGNVLAYNKDLGCM